MMAKHSVLRNVLAYLLLCLAASHSAQAALHVFAYHDVQDQMNDDPHAVSTDNLIAHFSWLRSNGYTPVSVSDLLLAAEKPETMPEKAVLLSFDDGLASVYTHVFPALKLFGYPAVVSVVTDWIESSESVDYNGRSLDQSGFVTWAQLREMSESGLVEVASHTHNLHGGVRGNPQGNLQPAAVTRVYGDDGYENDAAYRQRITADLATSVGLLTERLGHPPRVLSWPYGAYSEMLVEISAGQGMPITLVLGVALNERVELSAIQREVVTGNPNLESFTTSLLYPPHPPLVRAAQVDLDYVYDPDPVQQERNLDLLIERIHTLDISHVLLQAFADPDADGGASALYFPSELLPLRADLFNRVAWQLKTRSNVNVFAWLPLLSFAGDRIDPSWRVLEQVDGQRAIDQDSEPRLSPFSADARAYINSIYRDLAKHASFDGILFHDDGRLNEHEDASPVALAAYRAEFGPDFTIPQAAEDPELSERWTRYKSKALLDLSEEVIETVRRYRPEIQTARNIFATALLDPNGERYLAQNFQDYLRVYDHVALMAMPALENARRARPFYAALAEAVAAEPHGLQRTLFELQTVDWRSGKPVTASELKNTMRWLQSLGVRHLAYYPDDFVTDHPQLDVLRRGISLARYPRVER
jgi:biofilm PGA synthesis lipoprotein PgaB